jgi:hypothetical protein
MARSRPGLILRSTCSPRRTYSAIFSGYHCIDRRFVAALYFRIVGQPELILRHGPHRYTPSILRMIRSAHWTAPAINDSVLGLGRDSCRSSGFFRCRATKIPATMAKTRFRPSCHADHASIFAFCSLLTEIACKWVSFRLARDPKAASPGRERHCLFLDSYTTACVIAGGCWSTFS